MPRNIEIKARIDDLDGLSERARAAGGSQEELIIQEDVFFRVPIGKLKLRVFEDGHGELIRYRRAEGNEPRPSDYSIASTPTPGTLRTILADVLGEIGVVCKRRRLIMIGQTRVHLDDVENLGTFVELEVVLSERDTEQHGRAVALDLMDTLGIDSSRLLSESYVDLLATSD